VIRITIGGKKMPLAGTVVVILNDEDEILLLKRPPSVKWSPDKWALPGGKLESGETSLVAVKRETKEETSLVIAALKKIPIVLDKPVVSYYTRHYSGSIQLDHEHTDWSWVSRSDITTYDLAPGVLQLFDWVLKNG
jgi:8-oxo-dGTP diphosphatase